MVNSLCVESPPGTVREGWRTVCGLADRLKDRRALRLPAHRRQKLADHAAQISGVKKRRHSVRRCVRLEIGLPSPVAELAATSGLFTQPSSGVKVWICPFGGMLVGKTQTIGIVAIGPSPLQGALDNLSAGCGS